MTSTILFTPSNEQLVAIAKEHPELNEKIRQEVIAQLAKNAGEQVSRRLREHAQTAYDNLCREVEGKFFKRNSSWSSNSIEFTPELKQKLSRELEQQLDDEFSLAVQTYLASDSFKTDLRLKVRQKVLERAMTMLDEEINQEAKKLVA